MAHAVQTARLDLAVPVAADLDELYAIHADPRVWTHYPSLRHATIETTQAMLDRWIDDWERYGLGSWIVRERDSKIIIGCGGCSVRKDAYANLGYRFSPDVQGKGYATELSHAGIEEARRLRPELPIVAYLVEHNRASARVAEKVGLTLQHRAPDAGNPDPDVMRLIYADRKLTSEELAAALG